MIRREAKQHLNQSFIFSYRSLQQTNSIQRQKYLSTDRKPLAKVSIVMSLTTIISKIVSESQILSKGHLINEHTISRSLLRDYFFSFSYDLVSEQAHIPLPFTCPSRICLCVFSIGPVIGWSGEFGAQKRPVTSQWVYVPLRPWHLFVCMFAVVRLAVTVTQKATTNPL